MKITTETKIKEIIDDGWELDRNRGTLTIRDRNRGTGDIKISIRQKKFKTLDDYENDLLGPPDERCDDPLSLNFYRFLKSLHPRLYWSVILQNIANDICSNGEERTYFMGASNHWRFENNQKPVGCVLFDTLEHVNFARNLLGRNIQHLL